jgi:hypothetical protein
MIAKGILNRRELGLQPYIIRVLGKNDVPQILDLQDTVLGSMKNKNFCVFLSPEEHYEIMDGNGESIGVFVEGRLGAVCSILFPGHRKDNMARELDFSDEELPLVAQLELSMVHPDLQGNNLQVKLAQLLPKFGAPVIVYIIW